MLGSLQDDETTKEAFVDPRESGDYQQWVLLGLKGSLSSSGSLGGARLKMAVESRAPPVTWVEVRIQGVKKSDIVLLQAWRRESNGGWRFDAGETMKRFRRESQSKTKNVRRDFSL